MMVKFCLAFISAASLHMVTAGASYPVLTMFVGGFCFGGLMTQVYLDTRRWPW